MHLKVKDYTCEKKLRVESFGEKNLKLRSQLRSHSKNMLTIAFLIIHGSYLNTTSFSQTS